MTPNDTLLPPGFTPLTEPAPQAGSLTDPPEATYTPGEGGGSLRLNARAALMFWGVGMVAVAYNPDTCELLISPDPAGRALMSGPGGSVTVSLSGLPADNLPEQAAYAEPLAAGSVLVRLRPPAGRAPRPVWPHGDSSSIFLGHAPFQGEQADVYLLPRGALPWRSLLIRFGPGPDYTSGREEDWQRIVDDGNGHIGTRAAYRAALALLAAYGAGSAP